jgi:acetate kinase
MNGTILVVNSGSSSAKFTVYDYRDERLAMRYDGQIDGIGTAPHFVATDNQGQIVNDTRWDVSSAETAHSIALRQLGSWLRASVDETSLLGVGHRVVHGGPKYSAPVVITEPVLTDLESLIPLAPLHQPHNLVAIRGLADALPDVPQVACFDTAFHRGHSPVVDRFALPDEFYDAGVRRYGFHGLSYEYIVGALPKFAPEIAGGRVVVAHLGSGASLCAIHNGRSVDTTMGLTGLDGLPMGTRCGAIDPGVLLYLMQAKQMDAAQIEDLIYRRSGLLGISGVSSDMRALLASDDPQAALAIDYFVYRVVRELGAMAAALSGVDALVFTAGIGERAAELRARICRGAAWLGVKLDEAANQRHGPRITTAASHVSAWVIPTDEERMIALHTIAVLAGRPQPEEARCV